MVVPTSDWRLRGREVGAGTVVENGLDTIREDR